MVETRSKGGKSVMTDNSVVPEEPRTTVTSEAGGAVVRDSTAPPAVSAVATSAVTPVLGPVASEMIPDTRDREEILSVSSRRSTSTIVAQRLAVEAELRRRQLERDLVLLEQTERKRREVEEIELQATLAALEAENSRQGSTRSRVSSHARTHRWVQDVAGSQPEVPHVLPVTQGRPAPQTAAPLSHTMAMPTQTAVQDTTPQAPTTSTDAIGQLAVSISQLAGQSRKESLPTFTGSYKEWLTFKNSYFRSRSQHSPSVNITRLAEALRGAARETVEVLLHTTDDPDNILSVLEQTYARPELIVSQEVAALRVYPKVGGAEQLNKFANRVRNTVASMQALKQRDYLYSPEILRCVLSKLSELTKARFTDFAADTQEENVSKLETLSAFLLREADRQLRYTYAPEYTTAPATAVKLTSSVPKRESVHSTSTEVSNVPECSYCQRNHVLTVCKEFGSLSIDDRWRWVRETKLCFRCLKGGAHRWNSCKAKRCGKDGCARRHHSLLHGLANTTTLHSAPEQPPTTNPCLHTTTNVSTSNSNERHMAAPDTVTVSNVKVPELPCNISGTPQPPARPRALLKVLPVVVSGAGGEYETYALLDDGSSATLIDADVALRIGARETSRQALRIDGVGGMFKETTVGNISFYIRGRKKSEQYLIENARSIHGLALRPQTIPKVSLCTYNHLVELADTLAVNNATPTVLIGACDWHLTISREVRCGKPSEPVATRTLLGWTLHGCLSSSVKPVEFVNHLSEEQCDSVEALMREQYRLDCIGISKLPPKNSEDDQRAIDIVESTARRLLSGRFEVGLPWRQTSPGGLPDSYHQALSRFKSLEKQIAKDEGFAQAYRGFVEGVIQKGYAEECPADTYHSKTTVDTSSSNSIRWYLPHFGVYHPQKKKIRVVHDAAAATRGVCLNDLLLTGPDLLQSLLGILFRFREGKVAVTGDIREMFPQIKIKDCDRDAQRFLWRESNLSPIKEYRMSSMTFGAVSSPFIANYIKNKNALEFESTFPEAAMEVIQNHYMDDYIGSFDDIDVAAKVAADVYTVHSKCCFEMRSWLANDVRVLRDIPTALWANPNSEAVLATDVSTLGLKWNPSTDTIGFRTGCFENPPPKLTKRVVLSHVMKVYDPLGLLTPTVIKGRILIQNLWREKLGWDDDLPARYVTTWTDWAKEIALLGNLYVPRWYLGNDLHPVNTQLHIFCDSSELAYACVAYWRFELEDGSVKLCLIGSKARVTPLKPCSIPRLELQAALIAVRLAKTIEESHRLKPSSTTFWSDSTTVLKWLRGDARRYKRFVAHRVGEILELTNPSDWRWVPTDLNVADDATRLSDLNHRWFTGPPFLLGPSKDWPGEPDLTEDAPLPDVKEVSVLLTDTELLGPPVPDPNRFSVWLRLLRASACVILAARKFRSFISTSLSPNSKLFTNDVLSLTQVTAFDTKLAEKLLLVKSQIDRFGHEILLVREAKLLNKTSRLFPFSPRLHDGLLVMDSRIKSLPTEDETIRTRILLDDRHRVVRLLVTHHHVRAGHGFHELVFNELRRRFWILRGRRAVKTVARECQECKRRKKAPVHPPFGDLPKERLEHVRPFTNVGLDYFGPIEVTIGRRHEKRWVALYTCLVTRAVHLEIVNTLSTDSAIMSLRRFIARRGCPAKIISDNGTAFVGASRELKALFGRQVDEFAANNTIHWAFLPPASPFKAGATERMVRSVKTALKATLRDRAPKEEILVTLLMEAEAIINSRPLSYVTSASETPIAITPFHFLIGTSSNAQWLAGDLDDAEIARRTQWRATLRLADHFWARWLREYLPTLIRRPSCNDPSPVLKVGDVVVVADDTLPRGLWPLGRISRTYPGLDGVIRVADIAIRGGVLKRPTRQLVQLDATDQSAATP